MGDAASKLEAPNADVLSAFAPYEQFCKAMLDAYVVLDADGHIVKCNQLFTQLVGQTTKAVLKTGALSNLLRFELNKKEWSSTDILSHRAPTRIDEVRGKNHQRDDLNLIIGVFPLVDPAQAEILGAFVLIRDVTAETALQGKYTDTAMKSITDPLTGLFTRSYFEDYLNMQVKNLAAAPRDQEIMSLTIALLDIDFFKKVNDNYGHQAGDHVLKITAGLMKKTFRKTDIACRYGGEEFLVILPGTDLAGAITATEKLREAVQNEVIEFNGTHIPVTISSGLAEINIGKEPYTDTIARADAALYESKRNGRNRVSIHNGKEIKPAK